MRGGGGSRGGGGRGGGFGGSRMMSSSRRYRRGYYGPYYGGYWGGYYGGGFSIIGAIFGLFIFGLVIILVIAAVFGSGSTITQTFGSQQQLLVDTSSYSSASFQTSTGSVSLYFFNNKPTVTGFTSSSETYPLVVGPNTYQYVYNYFPSGAKIGIGWSANAFVNFYIIVGSTNFDNWKNGNNNNAAYSSSGTTGTTTYTLSGKSNEVYFAFENLAQSTSVNVNLNFNFQTPAYDLSGATSHISSPSFQDKSISSKYVVVVNDGSNDATFSMQLNKQFGFGEIFLVLFIVYIGFLVWAGKKISEKSKQNKAKIPPQGPQMAQPNIQGAPDIYGSYANSGSMGQPAKPMDQPMYKQRPQPKYCKSCGSAVLQDALYCAECGSSV